MRNQFAEVVRVAGRTEAGDLVLHVPEEVEINFLLSVEERSECQ